MLRHLLLIVFALLSAACTNDNSTQPSCEEACKVCNMSNKALREQFGSTEVPKRFAFAMPYVDGVSYKAYMQCVNEAVKKKTTADALGCTQRADAVCVQACQNDR